MSPLKAQGGFSNPHSNVHFLVFNCVASVVSLTMCGLVSPNRAL